MTSTIKILAFNSTGRAAAAQIPAARERSRGSITRAISRWTRCRRALL